MTLQVIGAGLGRTATASLKAALEHLLDAPCHHMFEVIKHPEQIEHWAAAAEGQSVDWPALLDGYAAQVDWPGASFWPELMEAFPHALVLLSVRDHDRWFDSTQATIFAPPDPERQTAGGASSIMRMFLKIAAARFTTDLNDRAACVTAAEAHNQAVINGVPSERLLIWRAADGWEPICDRLGIPVPTEPFPHENTTADFQAHQHKSSE